MLGNRFRIFYIYIFGGVFSYKICFLHNPVEYKKKKLNNTIEPIDKTLTNTTFPGQS